MSIRVAAPLLVRATRCSAWPEPAGARATPWFNGRGNRLRELDSRKCLPRAPADSRGTAASGGAAGGKQRLAAGVPRAIRAAEPSDLERLEELEDLTAEGASWTRAQIQAELVRERATVLVVDEGGGPVGWTVGWRVPFELHLMNIAVHPTHRRRGHARALLAALIEQHRHEAEAVLLEVRASNSPALELYRSLGFEAVGRRPRYYQDGEDAVLMTKQLPGAGGQLAAGAGGEPSQ